MTPGEPAGPVRDALLAAGSAAAGAGDRVYAVGGMVRDLLLGRSPRDLDLAVESGAGESHTFATRLAALPGWSGTALHGRFGTATLRAPGGLRVDVAATRRESYPVAGALPSVTTGATILEDLGRRDFPVHAMARAVGPDGTLAAPLDPFGGARDVASGTIRLLHAGSLADDPTRLFRAARYLSRLSFRPDEPAFREALERSVAAGSWRSISGDRLRRSLEEVLAEERFEEALAWLSGVGGLSLVVAGWTFPPGRGGRGAPPVPDGGAVSRSGSPADHEAPLARRWRILLAGLEPPGRFAAAARLFFSRRLRRATGVPA